MTPTGITWLDYFAIPAALLMTLGVFTRVSVACVKLFRRVNHFLDDFFGEKERDGIPARPGVMARLASVEQADGDVADKIDTLCDDMRHEMRDERQQALNHHVQAFHIRPEGTPS